MSIYFDYVIFDGEKTELYIYVPIVKIEGIYDLVSSDKTCYTFYVDSFEEAEYKAKEFLEKYKEELKKNIDSFVLNKDY